MRAIKIKESILIPNDPKLFFLFWPHNPRFRYFLRLDLAYDSGQHKVFFVKMEAWALEIFSY